MAAPSFQAWGSYLATLTSGTPGAPASVAQGDMLLLVAEDQGTDATSPTTVSGGTETWTAHPSSPQYSSGATRLFVWWARASQASPTMPTVTAGVNHVFARVARFTGVKSSGDPWNGSEYNGSSNAAADGTIPGLTAASTDRLCIFLASTGYNGTNAARFSAWAENTTTVLSSLTEIHDQTDTIGGGGGFGGASALISSGGTTDGVDFTEAFAGHGMISLALSATADPTPQTLTGSTFTKAPTFPAATVTPGEVSLTGSVFTKAPTFPAGEVTQPAAEQDLTGATYQKAPTFPSSTVQGVYTLSGSTFTSAPSFPTGTASPGAVTLSGTLFERVPTFPTGSISAGAAQQDLTGSTYQQAPTFLAATAASVYTLTQYHFHAVPTFPTGAIVPGAVSLTGAAYQLAPTFPQSAIAQAGPQDVIGSVFTLAPTFPTGQLIVGVLGAPVIVARAALVPVREGKATLPP